MKNYKSVEILSIFIVSSPPHKPKVPLLKTFWRRFWLGSWPQTRRLK